MKLFLFAEEVVVRRVWHQGLLAYIGRGKATISRRSSTFGVQALDERSLRQEAAPSWTVVRAY